MKLVTQEDYEGAGLLPLKGLLDRFSAGWECSVDVVLDVLQIQLSVADPSKAKPFTRASFAAVVSNAIDIGTIIARVHDGTGEVGPNQEFIFIARLT